MGFFGKFFVAIFAVCAAGGAWATGCTGNKQNCADGKYNRYGCVVGGLMPVTGYECVSCPAPFDKSGTTQQTIEDCYVEQHCGTGETCALYYGNQSGTCQNSTGNTGNYHLELVNNSAACCANTISCKAFDIDVFNGAWSCNKQSQTGTAQWVPAQNAWDTLDCACSVVNKDIGVNAGNTVVNCKKANAIYYVAQADRYRTRKLSEHVYYSIERSWCAQCYPGYLPNPVAGQSDGIGVRPDDNGNWGVRQCDIQVTQPDYADGCVIDFGLSTGAAAYDDCRQECPTGFETEEPGAESITDCVARYTPEFEDQTGRFVLTSLDSCQ